MFTLLAAFIATFVALCKGLMLLIGVLLGGVTALIEAWHAHDTVGARA
jgi:hypothetical protein